MRACKQWRHLREGFSLWTHSPLSVLHCDTDKNWEFDWLNFLHPFFAEVHNDKHQKNHSVLGEGASSILQSNRLLKNTVLMAYLSPCTLPPLGYLGRAFWMRWLNIYFGSRLTANTIWCEPQRCLGFVGSSLTVSQHHKPQFTLLKEGGGDMIRWTDRGFVWCSS